MLNVIPVINVKCGVRYLCRSWVLERDCGVCGDFNAVGDRNERRGVRNT
jgi:hypothetical protein